MIMYTKIITLATLTLVFAFAQNGNGNDVMINNGRDLHQSPGARTRRLLGTLHTKIVVIYKPEKYQPRLNKWTQRHFWHQKNVGFKRNCYRKIARRVIDQYFLDKGVWKYPAEVETDNDIEKIPEKHGVLVEKGDQKLFNIAFRLEVKKLLAKKKKIWKRNFIAVQYTPEFRKHETETWKEYYFRDNINNRNNAYRKIANKIITKYNWILKVKKFSKTWFDLRVVKGRGNQQKFQEAFVKEFETQKCNIQKSPEDSEEEKSDSLMLSDSSKLSEYDLDKVYKKLEKKCNKFLEKSNIQNNAWQQLRDLANNPFRSNKQRNKTWNGEMINKFITNSLSSRPILHGDMMILLKTWLERKREQGSSLEKHVYEKMNAVGLLDRLVTKRSIVFYKERDYTWDRDGKKGYLDWNNVGTNRDMSGKLIEYLSYDEMLLASLIGVSSQVQPVNDGARENNGKKGGDGTYVTSAVYIGLVGCRWERSVQDQMEWRHMVAKENRNYDDYPTLSAFEKFYGVAKGTMTRYTKSNNPCFPDVDRSDGYKEHLIPEVLRARFKKTAELHLFEAQIRGEKASKDVRAVTVGLGLGNWLDGIKHLVLHENTSFIKMMYINSWLDAIHKHRSELTQIKTLEFQFEFKGLFEWMKDERKNKKDTKKEHPFILEFDMEGPFKDEETKNEEYYRFCDSPELRIVFTDEKINTLRHGKPFAKGYTDELIVANFAYDANAAPGNEYWVGLLTGSGDPAAACCCPIPFLLNGSVNERISGKYGMVVNPKNGKPCLLTTTINELAYV